MTSSLRLLPYILILYYIKQIDSMLACICSVIDHRGRQNVVRTSVTHSCSCASCATFCSYHILTSSVIYYWTDAQQHGIYLLNMLAIMHFPILQLCVAWVSVDHNLTQGFFRVLLISSYHQTGFMEEFSEQKETYIRRRGRLSSSSGIEITHKEHVFFLS